MSDSMQTLNDHTQSEYKYGWSTQLDMDVLPRGLTEDTVRWISARKEEPEWMLEWRLQAYRHWLTMKEPTWANVHYPKINYQDIIYFAAPRKKLNSLDEADPELLSMFDRLGVPLEERNILAGVAVDAVIDSVSVTTTFKKQLGEMGIIFCSFSEAVK
ncbi:MAG TPA: hypothetical protein VN763_16495 [Saprospiraceae bacterium]|nr:hypothetical protein [Saprospiraceae bacterium]